MYDLEAIVLILIRVIIAYNISMSYCLKREEERVFFFLSYKNIYRIYNKQHVEEKKECEYDVSNNRWCCNKINRNESFNKIKIGYGAEFMEYCQAHSFLH